MGALAAGVVVGAGGFVFASTPLVFAGVVLVLLVVATLVSIAFRAPRIDVDRRFSPARATAGDDVTESIRLRSAVGSPLAVRVRETVAWRVMASDEAASATIPPRGAAVVSFVHVDLPRGRHRIGPARVDIVESFGLARRLVPVAGRAELVVVPQVAVIGAGRESHSLGEGARRRRDHSVAAGQDDPITREYRRGDPMRRVHWRATARQGELMVRQEEQHGLPSVRVVVPTAEANWRDAHPWPGSRTPVSDGFEWALSAAASLAVEFGMVGSQTRVVSLRGDTLALHDPSSTGLFLEALADFALGDPTDERSPDPAPREPVIAIVSTLTPTELDSLGRLRGPGVKGVAVVLHLDADLLSPNDTDHDSPRDVADALVARGWTVVEAASNDEVGRVLAREAVRGG